MRSRLSKPSPEDVLEFYGQDVLSLIADRLLVDIGDVLAMYMSKVGTWRNTPSFDKVVDIGDVLAMKAQWWTYAMDKIEGAPEWLYDEFVWYWARWWEEREDQRFLGYGDETQLINGQFVYGEPPRLP